MLSTCKNERVGGGRQIYSDVNDVFYSCASSCNPAIRLRRMDASKKRYLHSTKASSFCLTKLNPHRWLLSGLLVFHPCVGLFSLPLLCYASAPVRCCVEWSLGLSGCSLLHYVAGLASGPVGRLSFYHRPGPGPARPRLLISDSDDSPLAHLYLGCLVPLDCF